MNNIEAPTRIREIATNLRRYFPLENYGYANAIQQGRLRVDGAGQNRRLTLDNPSIPYPSSIPFPFFTCDPASTVVLYELGLPSQKVEVYIPYIAPEQNRQGEFLIHKMVVAREGTTRYIIGMTPYDFLLGIDPLLEVPSEGRFAPLSRCLLQHNSLAGSLYIKEEPAWLLQGLDPQIKPLRANFIDLEGFGFRLFSSDLGAGIEQGSFYIASVNRQVRFENWNLIIEREVLFCLFLPLGRLSWVIGKINEYAENHSAARRFLYGNKLLAGGEEIFNHRNLDDFQQFIFDIWPIISTFITKLPVGQL